MGVVSIHARHELFECRNGERRLTDDCCTRRLRHVGFKGKAVEKLCELGRMCRAGAIETLEHRDRDRLPEVAAVEQSHQEEVAAPLLHALTDLSEKVRLARARYAADHHADGAG